MAYGQNAPSCDPLNQRYTNAIIQIIPKRL